jgi:hypothetical protein
MRAFAVAPEDKFSFIAARGHMYQPPAFSIRNGRAMSAILPSLMPLCQLYNCEM